ncbi:MAG: histidine kinase dimerization/phosphoacceptor domain -containing protein [Dongiaceae bacterium]
MIEPFNQIEDARSLAQAIVDTVREPLLVLDRHLRVVAASRSYYLTFGVERGEVDGRTLYALGDGQWDIPSLRALLEKIGGGSAALEAFEVDRDFPGIGRRAMLLNARKVFYEDSSHTTILLAIEDVTERRAAEREKADLLCQTEELLRQKEVLLQEMQHRVANSLQIIASVLLLKARTVTSEETRLHLNDAHRRVMSVAAVQEHLHASWQGDLIQIGPYLTKLCESLAASMIADSRPVALRVVADGGAIMSSKAASLGLIVTELVINCLKHAFPTDRQNSEVVVSFEVNGSDWNLVVADNGVGKPAGGAMLPKDGLGTSLISALAHQLDAKVDVVSSPAGTRVAISHATFTSRLV